MALTEIIASLKQLSHQEKIKAIQFLATELASDEAASFALEDGKTYEI
jgi:hypothetical protein